MKESYKEALKLEHQAKKLKDKRKLEEAADKFKDAAYIWQKSQNKRNYLWCMANYHFHQGMAFLKSKKYEEANSQFESSKELFEKRGVTKQVIVCEAYMYEAKAHMERINHNFGESAKLFFKACELITSISVRSRRYYEYEAYISLGFGEMRNGNYSEAKNYFRLAQAIAEILGDHQIVNWAKAHECECEYYTAKDEGDIKQIIEALNKVVGGYAKTKDRTALFVSEGDLAKYRGLWLKIKKKFNAAAKCFYDAEFWYSQALKSDPKHADRHRFSVRYASALVTGTKADIDLINYNFDSASMNYVEASGKFAGCHDEKSAIIYKNLSQLSQSLASGNVNQALSVLKKLSRKFKLPPKPPSVKEFISVIGPIISDYTSKMVKEIIELDKGPSFEARVRELIQLFDDREVNGKQIGVLPPIKKLKLNRYEKVERKIFKPKPDEIGVVFKDNTPVEIDILAERKEGNRKFLLVAECQHSPSRVIKTHELNLLVKKAALVEIRYKKLAELQEEYEPKIEHKLFITTGNFSNSAVEFAQVNDIKLIGITALNNLLKQFGFPRIR